MMNRVWWRSVDQKTRMWVSGYQRNRIEDDSVYELTRCFVTIRPFDYAQGMLIGISMFEKTKPIYAGKN
jgi:hypothetical protein